MKNKENIQFITPIRKATYKRIEGDLNALAAAGYIEFKKKVHRGDCDIDNSFYLSVKVIRSELEQMIRMAEEY